MCTVNNHQILFASPLLTKEISVSAALIGSLLCVLSKDGTQEVKCSDAFIVERLGLTGRTVCRVKKALVEKGYITVSHHADKKAVTHYHILKKLVDAFFMPETNNKNFSTVPCEEKTQKTASNVDCQNGALLCQTGYIYSHLDINFGQNVSSEQDANASDMIVTDIRQSGNLLQTKTVLACDLVANKKQYKNNIKTLGKTHDAREENFAPANENPFADVPLPTDDDYIELEDQDNLENNQPTPLTQSTAPAVQGKEKSSAKRETNKKITYPQSKEETLKLFEQWRDEHAEIEPRIMGVNLVLEAEKYFDYWDARNWCRKGKTKIKSLKASIGTWLGLAIDKVPHNFKPVAVAQPKPKYDPDEFISSDEAIERGLCTAIEAVSLMNFDGYIPRIKLSKDLKDTPFEVVQNTGDEANLVEVAK